VEAKGPALREHITRNGEALDLHALCAKNDYDSVKLFVEQHGADGINEKAPDGNTALSFALMNVPALSFLYNLFWVTCLFWLPLSLCSSDGLELPVLLEVFMFALDGRVVRHQQVGVRAT